MSRTTQNVNSIAATIISVSVNVMIIALVIMGIYVFGTWGYNFGNAVFDPSPVDEYNGKSVVVTVPEGASVQDIAKIMERSGIVRNSYVFMVQMYLSEYKDEIVPGTYTLSTTMLPDEILAAIAPKSEEEE
jgi:UPF0755 protein